MYKHLLIPTDGTPLSEYVARHGIQFAREAGAKVTAFYAMPEFTLMPYEVGGLETREQFEKNARSKADGILAAVEAIAHQEGVPCDTDTVASDKPYEAIIDAARGHDCDLIFMASHGRKGIAGILLGSETNKVLTHCKLPVLVHR